MFGVQGVGFTGASGRGVTCSMLGEVGLNYARRLLMDGFATLAQAVNPNKISGTIPI